MSHCRGQQGRAEGPGGHPGAPRAPRTAPRGAHRRKWPGLAGLAWSSRPGLADMPGRGRRYAHHLHHPLPETLPPQPRRSRCAPGYLLTYPVAHRLHATPAGITLHATFAGITHLGGTVLPATSRAGRERGRGEMAYAAGLGPVGGDTVGVQIPPPALNETRCAAGFTRRN